MSQAPGGDVPPDGEHALPPRPDDPVAHARQSSGAPARDGLGKELAGRVTTRGHFRLSSGRHADTYLQCARALGDPAFALRLGDALAGQVRERVGGRIDAVASPAIGGVLAGFVVAAAVERRFLFTERRDGRMALRRGQAVTPGERVVMVEDVLTTGGSAREAADVLTFRGAEIVAYAALVDRSTAAHPLPFDAVALLRVQPATWDAAACPLCAAGQPVDRPGSREP